MIIIIKKKNMMKICNVMIFFMFENSTTSIAESLSLRNLCLIFYTCGNCVGTQPLKNEKKIVFHESVDVFEMK